MTPQQAQALQQAAEQAAQSAYAPYSKFRVGAALLLADGTIVTGCNVENASYGLAICAERTAVTRAVIEKGPKIRIHAIAVANLNQAASAPCGACRQVLSEFAQDDAIIFFPTTESAPANPEHPNRQTYRSQPFFDLLPFAFRPSDLGEPA